MASVDIPQPGAIASRAPAAVSEARWLHYAAGTVVYLVASALTRPVFLGDTMYYLRTAHPGATEFWDFGHLIWRPLLWILLQQFSAAERSAKFLLAFHALDFASTVAGLVTVWLTIATIRLFTCRVGAIIGTAIVMSFSQVVLTYSKGGCTYIFGLLALTAGLYILLRGANREQSVRYDWVVCAALLALSVSLWLPYVLAIPGVLISPLLFSEARRRPGRLVIGVALVTGLVTAIAYAAVAMHLGICDLHGFAAWEASSSHAVTISGAKRVVFGFARSFLSTGENGSTFKRYLLHDPYNPVSLRQVFGVTLWRVMAFYVFLASVLASALRSSLGRSAGLAFLVGSLPVLAFAVAWQGTDLERYLPLYPSLMLVIGLAFSRARLRSTTGCIIGTFIAMLVVANVLAFSAWSRERQLREVTGTMRSLNALLPSESLVLLPPMHPLQRIYWDFPEALPLAEHQLKLERIVDLGTADTPRWRTLVASDIRSRWEKETPVVIDSSLLQDKPVANSSWVEGDDPRVHWRDIHAFVSKLEVGPRVGDTNFFAIPATKQNISTIDGF